VGVNIAAESTSPRAKLALRTIVESFGAHSLALVGG
jgi:hypothetical protein